MIALISPGAVRLLSQAAQRASDLGSRLFVPVDVPWEGFLDQVRQQVGAINISYRVNRRVSGALHEETLYSKPHRTLDDKGKAVEYRHVRKPLSAMSVNEVEDIVDPRVRQLVQEKLRQIGGDAKKALKAFADANNVPYFKASDGRIIPIRKARIRKNVATIGIGRGESQRHVAPGANHHMEIVAVVDKDGREKKWEGHIVSLFEAVGRRRRGEPVIQRDHGEGKRFMFSLAGGEYVEMEHEPGKRGLYRVVVISGSNVEFRLHADARASTLLRKTSGSRITRSVDSLRKVNARKVAVDPLGNVIPAHD